MNCMRMRVGALLLAFFFSFALLHLGNAQDIMSSPAPAPSSDGTTIDQGIAYLLLLIALAITYLVH